MTPARKANPFSPSSTSAATLSPPLKLLRALLPPPRQPITAARLTPLISFLLAFPLLCLLLDQTDTLVFTRLWPFWLLAAAPWLWWMGEAGYAGLSRTRALVAMIARFLLLGLFIIVLAEPRAVRKDAGLNIIFVVDASASIRETTPAMQKELGAVKSRSDAIHYVLRMVQDKPEKDNAGLIFFGRTAAVELPPGPVLPYDDKNNVMNVQIDYDGTDISKALSLAAALLPKDRNGRIVLVSDGVETEGNLPTILDELKAAGIPVDVRPIRYQYDNEVWVEHLELPRAVKLGETYDASVIVSSLQKGKGVLSLTENGRVVFQQEVEFQEGKNRYEIPVSLRQSGYYEYAASIDVPDEKDEQGNVLKVHDQKKENNKAVSHLYIRGKGRVLVVTDPSGNPLDIERLVQALRAGSRDVEVRSATEFSRDAAGLQDEDCIIFANAPANAFDPQQLQALHDAVYHQGSGFLMIGGAASYGPGGWHKTVVEQALPVSMDLSQKKVLPKGALAIILHTCEFPQGNVWAKNITKQAIRVLNERDEVGCLAQDFQGNDYWVFNLMPAGEFEEITKKLNAASLGDMMSFGPTMSMALNALQQSDASAKHMIIISDGDAQPPSPALLKQIVDAKISITTVTIWPHAGTTGQEVQLMASIAKMTGGRHYVPQTPNELPSIFIKEATTLRRSAIQEFDPGFSPVKVATEEFFKDIGPLPLLRGYVLTTPKPQSLTILDGPEEDEIDPVLSYWRYGTGQSAAWTSDLSAKWAQHWQNWPNYDAFVQQIVTRLSRASGHITLRVRSFAAGGQGVVIIEDYGAKDRFLAMEAQVTGPRGLKKAVPIRQVGPNRYEGKFPLAGEGTYNIVLAGIDPTKPSNDPAYKQVVVDRLVLPYSQEYLRFRANPLVLEQIAKRTDGRELTGVETGEQLYLREKKPKTSSLPVVDWFLLLLACVIPLEVGLRRVQVDWELVRSWLWLRREAPSEETFAKLKRKKGEVGDTLRRRVAEPPPPAATGPDLDLPLSAKPPPLPTAKKPAEQDKPQDDTTSRLLRAKRRVQDQREDGAES